MAKGLYLGEFEQLILLAVLRLGDNSYGVTIRQEIETRTGRTSAIGAVYATLDRLQRKGLVTSYLADPTAERGGRAKRYFQVTLKGKLALQQSQDAVLKMKKGLKWAGSVST